MKIIKLKDVLKDPTHPIMQDVMRNEATNPGDELICKKCGKKYIRGVWDFYSLCNKCFVEFDEKKMKARFKMIFGNSS